MISINLLPEGQRCKEQKISLPYKGVYVLVAFVVVLLLHFFLISVTMIKKVQVDNLKKSWERLEPSTKDAVAIKKEIKDLEAKTNEIKGFLSRKGSLAEVLSSLNSAVPKGLWLEHFSFSKEGLMIQGSVVSLNQGEMSIISRFLQDLKSNKVFETLFSKIELNSVQRRMIKTYDVVDFILVGEIKK